MQAHNSARLAVLGSAEMLQNAWFAEKATLAGKEIKTANRDFAEKLSSWTFKETGVLKVGKLIHYLDEGVSKKLNTSVAVPENNPKIYRIKQDVVSLLNLFPRITATANTPRPSKSKSQNTPTRT
jgi:oligosaccharyltransferase complex subunit beta